jgi:hypothetical protein
VKKKIKSKKRKTFVLKFVKYIVPLYNILPIPGNRIPRNKNKIARYIKMSLCVKREIINKNNIKELKDRK